MCLRIGIVHNKECGKYHSFTAEKDLWVIKQLSVKDDYYYTPYMHEPIEFDERGVFLLVADGMGLLIETSDPNIYHGIHSIRCRDFGNISRVWDSGFFIGVIRKGTHFYFGDNEDVVSEELLVFKTEEAFNEYRKEKEMPFSAGDYYREKEVKRQLTIINKTISKVGTIFDITNK